LSFTTNVRVPFQAKTVADRRDLVCPQRLAVDASAKIEPPAPTDRGRLVVFNTPILCL
jgi:hypothetical protein